MRNLNMLAISALSVFLAPSFAAAQRITTFEETEYECCWIAACDGVDTHYFATDIDQEAASDQARTDAEAHICPPSGEEPVDPVVSFHECLTISKLRSSAQSGFRYKSGTRPWQIVLHVCSPNGAGPNFAVSYRGATYREAWCRARAKVRTMAREIYGCGCYCWRTEIRQRPCGCGNCCTTQKCPVGNRCSACR